MAWLKGQSGNPAGKSPTKPFAEALSMEISAAGGDHRLLRRLAARLLKICESDDDRIALQGIQTLFDRLDGKVQSAQELTLEGHDGKSMTIRWET